MLAREGGFGVWGLGRPVGVRNTVRENGVDHARVCVLGGGVVEGCAAATKAHPPPPIPLPHPHPTDLAQPRSKTDTRAIITYSWGSACREGHREEEGNTNANPLRWLENAPSGNGRGGGRGGGTVLVGRAPNAKRSH